MLRVEVIGLHRRAAELRRRHELLIERVASFPNVVSESKERELAASRADVEARIVDLEVRLLDVAQ